MARFLTNFFMGLFIFGIFWGIMAGIPILLSAKPITIGEVIIMISVLSTFSALLVAGLVDAKDPILVGITTGLKTDFRNFFVNTPYEQIGSWQQNISREEWLNLQKQYKDSV